MIDLATCTIQEAHAAHDAALAADPSRDYYDPTLPLHQWFALKELEQKRARFEAGNRNALLAAIRMCAKHALVLPAWVATAYIAAFDKVLNCDAKSWDDTFGRPYPKGAKLAAMRRQRELQFAVWNEVQAILMREPETAISVGLFEKVGEAMRPPIGKTLAEEYYYQLAHWYGGSARRPG